MFVDSIDVDPVSRVVPAGDLRSLRAGILNPAPDVRFGTHLCCSTRLFTNACAHRTSPSDWFANMKRNIFIQ